MNKAKTSYRNKLLFPKIVLTGFLIFCLLLGANLVIAQSWSPKAHQWQSVGGKLVFSGKHSFKTFWHSGGNEMFWKDDEDQRKIPPRHPWKDEVSSDVLVKKGQITVRGPGFLALLIRNKASATASLKFPKSGKVFVTAMLGRKEMYKKDNKWTGKWVTTSTIRDFDHSKPNYGWVPEGKTLTLEVWTSSEWTQDGVLWRGYAAPKEVEYEFWFFPREGGEVIEIKEEELKAEEKKNSPPKISLSIEPQEPETKDSITVKALASDPDGDPLTFTWFVNGVQKSSHDKSLFLDGLAAGKYIVEITVSDGRDSAMDKLTFRVRKKNEPPSCVLSFSPADPVEGDTVIVSASASDPDGDSLIYSWSINQGASQQGSGALTVSDAALGTYNVKLDVSDGKPGGDSSCLVSFTVKPKPQKNRPPELNPDYSPASPRVGDTVTVYANGSDPDGDSIEYTYIHNGNVIKANTAEGSVVIPERFEGPHTIEIIADDGKGGQTQKTVSFTVECDCQDWRVTELIVSDDNPIARDSLKILAEIHNRCRNRIECPVTITVNGVIVFNKDLSVKAEDKQQVTVEYCLPTSLGGRQVPVRAQVGNDFKEMMISVKRETPARITGTVLEVGTLDAVAGATVIARPKSIVNPSGIVVNASQTFQASVRNDGNYTIDVDLSKAVDPSARTPEMECSVLVVEFDVTVDESPEYLGPSFGIMDCGKKVVVRKRQTTTMIDFRLAPITVRGQDIIFSHLQMRNGEIKEQGGPITQLELSPGTYDISVGGGKQTYVTLSYVLSGDPGTQLVIRVSIDEYCQLKTASLFVPEGQLAMSFRFQIYSTWMPCQGQTFPDSIGFVIKRRQ